jgi:hypothetical protein
MRLPTRAELEPARTGWIKQAGPTKADLSLVDVGDGPLVVKDFGGKAAWVRWIGRIQIGRECRAYRWAGALAGLPKLIGRIDAHALALEKIEAEELVFKEDREVDGTRKHARLTAIVESMHRAGLYHLDLRGIDNVMIGPDGRIFVIDLGGAICLKPGGWLQRRFGAWFAMADRAALLKWKIILNAGAFTEEERAFERRHRFWRGFWIFNRKQRRSR